jgi:hypothetical protein
VDSGASTVTRWMRPSSQQLSMHNVIWHRRARMEHGRRPSHHRSGVCRFLVVIAHRASLPVYRAVRFSLDLDQATGVMPLRHGRREAEPSTVLAAMSQIDTAPDSHGVISRLAKSTDGGSESVGAFPQARSPSTLGRIGGWCPRWRRRRRDATASNQVVVGSSSF